MASTYLDKYRDAGVLILRIGLGGMFVIHGAFKILAGPQSWERLGMTMGLFGIHFLPAFWGSMATLSEFLGGICLVLGLYTRVACVFLTFTMIVAASMHINRGDGFNAASHAIEVGIVFASLLLIGPGKYSLDKRLR